MSRSRTIAFLACALVPIAFGFLALALGQDANWDLRNYHWYNPYAFLTGREETDFGAGSLYNPALDIPMYLAAQVLSARGVSYLLGLVHGLNFIALFVAAFALLRPLAETRRAWAAAALALVGVIGAGHIALVGTTFNDNIVSILIVAALAIVIQDTDLVFTGAARPAFARVAAAGLVLGIGVGFKQPAISFAVGFCLAFLCMAGSVWRRLFLAFWFGIGITAGLALSCGFWMWHLWRDFHNPFFPYFNNFFASPLGLAASYRDTRFIPGFFEALGFPVIFSLDPMRVGEIPFRDWRIGAAYIVLLITAVLFVMRRRAADPPVDTAAARYLVAAGVISFAVWTPLFGIYRYIIALEMLAPLAIAAAVAFWPVAVRTRTMIVAALLLLVTVTAQPGTWLRRATWTDHLVEVTPPPLPPGTLVALVGIEPLSYVIPALPPEVPVLRLQGYFTDPNDGDSGVNRLIRARLSAHDGPITLLAAAWEQPTAERALAYFGLSADFAACAAVQSNLKPTAEPGQDIFLCPVTKQDATAAP